jgi:hypothetical protein
MKRREFSRFVWRGEGIEEIQAEFLSFIVADSGESGRAARYAGIEVCRHRGTRQNGGKAGE